MSRVSAFPRWMSFPVLPWILSAAAAHPSAQTARLNAPFEYEAVVGDAYDFQLKPGGGFLFFRAADRRAGTQELFVASTLGTTEIQRKNRLLHPDRSVTEYQPSPVGNWIVFLADQDADDVFELYSRSPVDGAPRKLNGPLPASGDVKRFAITPDGTRVVYLANQDLASSLELYVVPIDGSASPVKLSGTLVAGGSVSSFGVSPGSTRVVFRADKDAQARYELYSAPLDASEPPVKLNLPLPLGGHVSTQPPAITSDDATVVFLAHINSSSYGLYRAPLDGSLAAVRVNAPPGSGDFVQQVVLGSDDQRVVYTAATLPGVTEVYSAPLDGSEAPVRLHPALPFDGGVSEFALAPDASRVAYVAAHGFDEHGHVLYELHSVPIDGSAAPLTLVTPPHGQEPLALTISPDSARVVYLTRRQADLESRELRSVPLDGSAAAVRLDSPSGWPANRQLGVGVDDMPFALSADSARVIYLWHPTGTTNEDVASRGLYCAPIDGSAAPLTLAPGGVSYRIATSLVGTRAYFVAALEDEGVNELYGITQQGTGLVKLSGKLARDTFADVAVPVGGVAAHALLGAGERVLHCADAREDEQFELYVGRADGGAPVLRLGSGEVAGSFRASPDGTRVVYDAGDLLALSTDGSASPITLFDVPAGELLRDDFQVSPDGERVLFRAAAPYADPGLLTVPITGGVALQLEQREVVRFVLSASTGRVAYLVRPVDALPFLASAPIDGSAAPIQLDPGPVSMADLVLSPDGTLVAYTSDPGVAVVPVDGSAGPTVLSGILGASSPRFSPDGQWVVFAGRETPSEVELFSAKSDGSLGPLELSGPFVANGDLVTFAISPDSTRVVYLADQEVDERFELYVVDIDQSSLPRKLNGPLPVGGDVSIPSPILETFRIAPDGARVVYLADQEVDQRFELYSAPLGSVASPTKLSGDLVLGGDVATGSGASFLISPDSRLVVYRADQESEGLVDLYLVPIDRSLEPLALTRGLARPGVTFPALTPDSRRVVYQATERSQVTELFSTVLTFDPKRRHLASGGAHRP